MTTAANWPLVVKRAKNQVNRGVKQFHKRISWALPARLQYINFYSVDKRLKSSAHDGEEDGKAEEVIEWPDNDELGCEICGDTPANVMFLCTNVLMLRLE